MKTTTIYITKTADCYRFGMPPTVTMEEPGGCSRTWIKKMSVEIPNGFEVVLCKDERNRFFRDNNSFEMGIGKNGNPVIIDHVNWSYIPLRIIKEGWD